MRLHLAFIQTEIGISHDIQNCLTDWVFIAENFSEIHSIPNPSIQRQSKNKKIHFFLFIFIVLLMKCILENTEHGYNSQSNHTLPLRLVFPQYIYGYLFTNRNFQHHHCKRLLRQWRRTTSNFQLKNRKKKRNVHRINSIWWA